MKAKRIAALISATLGAASLHAQDEPAKQDTEKKEPEKEVYTWPTLDIGWQGYWINGLNRKYLHYATPADGLFVNDFRYLSTDANRDRYGYVRFSGVPEQDSWLQTMIALGYGNTVFEGLITRSNFYDDTPIPIDGSQRKIQEALLKEKIGATSVSVRYRMDQQDDVYEPPKQDLHQKTRFWDVSGDGSFKGTQYGLGFSDTRFMDYTGTVPFSETERWNLHFARQVTPALALDGSYSQSQVNQSLLAGANIGSLNLGGDWSVGPTGALLFNYKQDWLDMPSVQNAYVRRRIAGSVQYVDHFGPWSAQLSYRHREAERLRMDQSFVDVPIWDIYEAKFGRKLAEGLRLNVRGSFEHMSGTPVMQTDDPAPLYWRNRSMAMVKLDHSSDKCSAYGSVTFRNVQNTDRGFELDTTSYLLGGSYDVNPYVSLFGEWSLDQNQVGGAPADSPDYRSFFPSGRVITAGLNWSVRPSTWLSAAFTDFTTANDNPLFLRDGNVSGRFFTLSLKHRTASGNEYGLVFAPWSYQDSVSSQMNYTTSLLMITAGVRF